MFEYAMLITFVSVICIASLDYLANAAQQNNLYSECNINGHGKDSCRALARDCAFNNTFVSCDTIHTPAS